MRLQLQLILLNKDYRCTVSVGMNIPDLFRSTFYWTSVVHATKFDKYLRYSGVFPALQTIMETNFLGGTFFDASIN